MFRPDLSPRPDVDLSSKEFFNIHYHFIEKTDESANVNIYANPLDKNTLQKITDAHNDLNIRLLIWDDVDRYGKSFYSTVLADLGQQNKPNILTSNDTDLLEEYTANIAGFSHKLNAVMGPATSSYNETSQENFGPLEITPSTIHSQYLCQIPQRKPWSQLVLAILIADLVFLKLLWTVMNIAATWWVAKLDRDAMLCQGGIQRYHRAVDEEAGVIQLQNVSMETKGFDRVEDRGDNEGYRPVQGG